MMVLAEHLVDAAGTIACAVGPAAGRGGARAARGGIGPHALPLPGQASALRGHSFHWSRFDTTLQPACFTTPQRASGAAGGGEPVYECGSLRASWFHAWFASSPAATARLFLPAPLFQA
jgi:cobyrinic acid a,c-diamide synthase